MTEPAYVFQRVDDRRERERLRAIEGVFDPASWRWLLATDLQAGWHCLEVGPGAGSIMTSQVVEKARQHRSRIAQRLGSTGGCFPFAKIYYMGERPHKVRQVPPRLFARCGLAGRDF
jgi:hypothetical protein